MVRECSLHYIWIMLSNEAIETNSRLLCVILFNPVQILFTAVRTRSEHTGYFSIRYLALMYFLLSNLTDLAKEEVKWYTYRGPQDTSKLDSLICNNSRKTQSLCSLSYSVRLHGYRADSERWMGVILYSPQHVGSHLSVLPLLWF